MSEQQRLQTRAITRGSRRETSTRELFTIILIQIHAQRVKRVATNKTHNALFKRSFVPPFRMQSFMAELQVAAKWKQDTIQRTIAHSERTEPW